MVLVGGEITTNTYVDIQKVARDVVYDIGYTDPDYGIDYESYGGSKHDPLAVS